MSLGRASLLRQGRQQHLAVERLVTEPAHAPPSTQFTIDFLAAIQAEYEAQQRKAAGQLQFRKLPPPDAAPTPEK